MTVTKAQAVAASEQWGRVVFHYAPACTEKRVERWRTNGAVKLWKTRPSEFRLPVKFGLRGYSYITDLNADDFHLASECPFEQHRLA